MNGNSQPQHLISTVPESQNLTFGAYNDESTQQLDKPVQSLRPNTTEWY